jgi:uncharacterized phage-associated protein
MVSIMNKLPPFTFDEGKAIEVILHIAHTAKIADLIHICKILYFADKEHLQRYGRFICGDDYFAMKNGPVPSGTYDILKDVRRGRTKSHDVGFMIYDNVNIYPLRTTNFDLLSESDIETLDSAIAQYGAMPFDQLSAASHDAAWHAADENSMISLESIAKTLENSDQIIEYLRSQ